MTTFSAGAASPDPLWSVTACDNQSRCVIDNIEEIADGSTDIYFGPNAPPGKEKNWIPTARGKGWFTYFRLHAPTGAWFDRGWKLADIELVK